MAILSYLCHERMSTDISESKRTEKRPTLLHRLAFPGYIAYNDQHARCYSRVVMLSRLSLTCAIRTRLPGGWQTMHGHSIHEQASWINSMYIKLVFCAHYLQAVLTTYLSHSFLLLPEEMIVRPLQDQFSQKNEALHFTGS